MPGIVQRLLVGAGARAAGGAAVSAIGTAAAGAMGALSGLGRAAGALANAAANAADAARQNKNSNTSPNVIYVNFGMAGSAAKQKISGSGTIPNRPSSAKPQVSEKMPTEVLLDTAVKYLTSIDKSLKNQLQLEKKAYEQQARDTREATIENKSSFNFNDIKDRLSGFKSDTKENVSFAAKLAKYAVGIGAAAALIGSSLDQTQLDALRNNIDQFKQNFGWLGELAGSIGAAGLIGFLFGGRGVVGRLKGGLVGMVAAHVLDRLTGFFSGNNATDAEGNVVIDPQTGQPVRNNRSMSMLGLGLSTGAAAYATYDTVGRVRGLRQSFSNMRTLGRATSAASLSQLRASTIRGTGWLSSRRGRLFARILLRKLGRGIFQRLARYLARIVGGLLLTATGIGAIPGIVLTLVNVAFIAWDLWDIGTSIWEAWNESSAEETTSIAEATALNAARSDASNISGPGITATGTTSVGATAATSNTPGQSTATTWSDVGTNGQNKTITGVVEGGRGYTIVTYSDGTTERRTGTLPARANNPGNVMWGPFARSMGAVGGSPSTNGPPVAVFPTPAAGFAAMDANLVRNYSNGPIGQTIERWATDPTHPAKVIGTAGIDPNKRYTELTRDEKVRFMQALAKVEGYYAAGGGPNMVSASSTGVGGVGSTIAGAAAATIEQAAKMFGALGSTIVEPGVARNFTPSTSNVSERIDSTSMQLHNDIAFGIRRNESESAITSPTLPNLNPEVAQPTRSISNYDPNYANIDSVVRYLAHFRLAA